MNVLNQENFIATRTNEELGHMILSVSRELYNRNVNKQKAIIVKDINQPMDVIISQKP